MTTIESNHAKKFKNGLMARWGITPEILGNDYIYCGGFASEEYLNDGTEEAIQNKEAIAEKLQEAWEKSPLNIYEWEDFREQMKEERCCCYTPIEWNYVFALTKDPTNVDKVIILGSECVKKYIDKDFRKKRCVRCGEKHQNRVVDRCNECRLDDPKNRFCMWCDIKLDAINEKPLKYRKKFERNIHCCLNCCLRCGTKLSNTKFYNCYNCKDKYKGL